MTSLLLGQANRSMIKLMCDVQAEGTDCTQRGNSSKMAARRLTWKGCRDTYSGNYVYTLSYSLDIVWYHVFHTSVQIKYFPR